MSGPYRRPSICTASGLEFYPLDPRVVDVRLVDIAHALAAVARFAGHTRAPYSVAQHSVHVADLVGMLGGDRTAQRVALLHDASEAYLGDVPGPLKGEPQFAGYREAEARLQSVIYEAFGISEGDVVRYSDAVKRADRFAMHCEQRDLMPPVDWWEPKAPEVDEPELVPLAAEAARDAFLEAAASLALGGAS